MRQKEQNKMGQFVHVPWERWQLDILIELYPNTLTLDIAKKMDRGICSVRNKAYQLGLKKNKEFMQMTGRMSSDHPNCIKRRFKKGNVSHNKGKKWGEYMSHEGQENSLKTCFKKGNISLNRKSIGTERIGKGGCIEVKVKHGERWKFKHRLVWEQHHGKIPKGYNIQFKDRNPQNCNIENLYMIDRKNQIRENTIHNYPEDVKIAIRRVRKLEKIIKDRNNGQ